MDVSQLMWIAIVVLLVVAILQILYVFYLSVSMREARPVRQPSGPIMPTTPQGMTNAGLRNPAVQIGQGRMVPVSGLPGQKICPSPVTTSVSGVFTALRITFYWPLMRKVSRAVTPYSRVTRA